MTAKKKAEPEQPQGATCTVPTCDRPVYVRGLCEEHWADPSKA
jgi:hypothetical protein